jgi:FtsZ-binding cell division protein ZapB
MAAKKATKKVEEPIQEIENGSVDFKEQIELLESEIKTLKEEKNTLEKEVIDFENATKKLKNQIEKLETEKQNIQLVARTEIERLQNQKPDNIKMGEPIFKKGQTVYNYGDLSLPYTINQILGVTFEGEPIYKIISQGRNDMKVVFESNLDIVPFY